MQRPAFPFTACCLALVLAGGSPRAADARELDERIIVSGTAPDPVSPTSPGIDSARAVLGPVPGAVSVTGPGDLPRGRGAYLEDLLRFQPGLIIQSGQGTEDNKVSVRGSGIQNDDLSGLGILIDGIPLNQGDGEAYLYDVDLQAVKYSELFRGGDALRYGGAYLGGAINLVTLTGRDADPLTARASFGSFGFHEQGVTTAASGQRWDFFGSASNHFQDGYRDHSSENFQKVFLSLGTKLGASAENRLYFFYGRLEQDNPSGLDKGDLYAHPTRTDPLSIEQNWSTRWNYFRLVDRFVLRGDNFQFLAAVSYNHRTVTARELYEDDFKLGATRYYSDDFGANIAFESTADFLGGKNRLSVGIVPTFERESDSFYADESRELGALLFADKTYQLNLPLYVENQHYFTKNFSVLTGFQGVFTHQVFQDKFKSPSLGDQSNDDGFLAINPKLGFAYQWNDNGLVYLSATRSFQAPSFDESLAIVEGEDGGYQLRQLNSQGAITLELGTRGEAGRFQWDLALYRSWIKDELLDQNSERGQPLGTINAAHTIHQGIEFGAEVELLRSLLVHSEPLCVPDARDPKRTWMVAEDIRPDRLVFQQAYTFSDFHFEDDPVYGDNRVAGTPVHFLKAEVRYEHPSGFYLGTNVEWSAIKYPVDEANSLFADPYALLGVRLGYRTNKGLQLFFEAKNLTNKVYAASVEPLGDARSSDDTDSFNPGNGRAFYGGLQWVW